MTSRKRWWSDSWRRGAATLVASLLAVTLAWPAAAASQRKTPRRSVHTHASGGEIAELTATVASGINGRASFYGKEFAGRRTSTGELFDSRLFTAASNHFALGTMVSVQRLDSTRCAIVKINDRMGGGHQRRIIDVSRGVAEYLGMVREGVVLVRVAPLKASSRTQAACQAAFEPEEDCPDCTVASTSAPRKSPTPSLNRIDVSVP